MLFESQADGTILTDVTGKEALVDHLPTFKALTLLMFYFPNTSRIGKRNGKVDLTCALGRKENWMEYW